MATPAQVAANRLNSLKSTGPRSAEGKAASRFNALKHGRDAASAVIPGEDPEALAELTAEYYQSIQPDGPLECFQVDTLIHCDWLRRRLRRCEAQLYAVLTESEESPTPLGAAWHRDASGPNALEKIFRQLASVERTYARALAELRRLQTQRQVQEPEEIELDNDLPRAIMEAAASIARPAETASPARQFGFVPQYSRAPRSTSVGRGPIGASYIYPGSR